MSKRCLVVGRFTGLSTLCIALGLPLDGKIFTIDNSEEFLPLAKKYWKQAKVENKIDSILGNGVEVMQSYIDRKYSFDFIFIDADKNNYPKKCHMWLSKNTSERNLEIAEILEDMIVPVMAIQSMDEEVLENIKSDNIAPETYYKYQKRFHSMGATTYSDLIIPLPGESNDSHLKGVRKLFDMDVDNFYIYFSITFYYNFIN